MCIRDRTGSAHEMEQPVTCPRPPDLAIPKPRSERHAFTGQCRAPARGLGRLERRPRFRLHQADDRRIAIVRACECLPARPEACHWLRGHLPVSYTHLRAHETVLDIVC